VSGLAAVSEKPLTLTLLVVLVSQSTNDPLVAAMARTLNENKGRLDEIKTRLAVRVATWGFVQGPEETRAKVNPYYQLVKDFRFRETKDTSRVHYSRPRVAAREGWMTAVEVEDRAGGRDGEHPAHSGVSGGLAKNPE